MRSIIPFNANTNSLFRGWFLTFQDAKSRTMQFEWWRKREKRKPAIRLVRDSSSDEGGARSVVTFLFWNGAQWRRRWFISWVSASISEQSALSFPNRRKASKLKRNLKFSSFFVSLHPLRVQVMDISPRHCVHCADRSTMPRDISSSSFSLLRFPPQFAP